MIELFVINLKKRYDRKENIEKNFCNYKINFVEAIEHEIGWIGCFLSHKKCIKIAKELGLIYQIVLEDDCICTNDFEEKLKNILEYLENNLGNWDIFLGGVTNVWDYNNLIKLNNNLNLINISKGKTFHFVIYNSSSYNFFLTHQNDQPIDKCWHYNLNTLTSIPFIAIQTNNFSDIENKYVNYKEKFSLVEKYLIKKIKNE